MYLHSHSSFHLFLHIFILLPVFVLATKCSRGSYISSSGCQLCAPGTYSDVIDSKACKPCPPGTFFDLLGAQTLQACRDCSPGTYSIAGAATCTTCPSGTNSTRSATKCVSCPPGTSIVNAEQPCQPCFSGTYQDLPNQLQCKNCPYANAAFTPKNATSKDQCQLCPLGTERGGFGVCSPCPPGRYRNDIKSDSCKTCALGTFSEKEGAIDCTPCSAGQVGIDPEIRYGQPSCIPCPDGSITYGKGQTLCRKSGMKCPSDHLETSLGDCLRCQPDQFYSTEQSRCLSCPSGMGSAGGLEKECRPCREIVNARIASSSCSIDLTLTISVPADKNGNCPSGSFKNMEADGACEGCQPGYYSNTTNAERCVPCPAGSVQAEPVHSYCTPCQSGSIAVNSLHCIVPQSACPPGTVRTVDKYGNDVCQQTGCGPPPPKGFFSLAPDPGCTAHEKMKPVSVPEIFDGMNTDGTDATKSPSFSDEKPESSKEPSIDSS